MTTTSDEHLSKITMQGIHVELTEAMKTSIRDKFGPLLRHNERIIRVNLRLQMDQTMGTEHHYTATGQVEIGGPDLVASMEGKDAYGVIDGLAEKLERLLHTRQGRRKDKRNHPHEVELDTVLPKVENNT